MSDEFFDKFRRNLEAKTHRYAVGRQIFCPNCQTVLDHRRSSSLEVSAPGGGVVFSRVVCDKCVPAVRTNLLTVLAAKPDFTATIFSGKTRKTEEVNV